MSGCKIEEDWLAVLIAFGLMVLAALGLRVTF